MRLPRPLADLYCTVHDLATSPRAVLLNRRHNQWRGPVLICAVSVPALLGRRPNPALARAALAIGGASFALDLAGLVAHVAWGRGRIWADAACEWCGLAVEVEEWLRTTGTGVAS